MTPPSRGSRSWLPVAAGLTIGLLAGVLMMAAAWEHNPQGKFRDEGGVHWGAWLGVGAAWLLVVGAVATALAFALRRVLRARRGDGPTDPAG
jgi:hypothetical protein